MNKKFSKLLLTSASAVALLAAYPSVAQNANEALGLDLPSITAEAATTAGNAFVERVMDLPNVSTIASKTPEEIEDHGRDMRSIRRAYDRLSAADKDATVEKWEGYLYQKERAIGNVFVDIIMDLHTIAEIEEFDTADFAAEQKAARRARNQYDDLSQVAKENASVVKWLEYLDLKEQPLGITFVDLVGAVPNVSTLEGLTEEELEVANKAIAAAEASYDELSDAAKADALVEKWLGYLANKKEAIADLEVIEEEPSVESVSAINGKEVEIKFNKAINKNTLFTNVSTGALNAANVIVTEIDSATANTYTGALSEDGKTLTLTASSKFAGSYTFKLTDDVKTTNGEAIAEYVKSIVVNDTVAPKVVSTSASAKTTTNTIYVNFDEPLDHSSVVAFVDDVASTVAINPNNNRQLIITSTNALEAGKTASIRLVNVKDAAGNFTASNPLTTSVVVAADTVAPTLQSVKVTSETTIELVYDKNMNASSFAGKARLVNSNGSATISLTPSAGDNLKTVVLTLGSNPTFTNGAFSGLLFIDAEGKDSAGNLTTAYSTSLVINEDKTAPSVSEVKYENGKLVVAFTEDIAADTTTAVKIINKATGEATDLTLAFSGTPNANIVDNKLEITTALADGSYEVRLGSATVKDKAITPNSNAVVIKDFVVSSVAANDTTKPAIASLALVGTAPVTGTAPAAEQAVTYDVTDAGGVDLATVRNINNYTWDGKALPVGSYVTTTINAGTASKATDVTVRINIPSNGIAVTKPAVFTVGNIKDLTGNAIASISTANVTLTDGIAPELTAASVVQTGLGVLTFSEAMGTVDAGDFVLTINGKEIKEEHYSVSQSPTNNKEYVVEVKGKVANDVTYNGDSKDLIYLDVVGTTAGYDDADDLVLSVLDDSTYADETATPTIALNGSSITGLKVKLVEESSSELKDVQGNKAVYDKTITIK